MSDTLLASLFQAYQANPDAPLDLPSGDKVFTPLCDAIKEAIDDALYNDEIDKAAHLVAFTWNIAHQSGQSAHHACAHWCSGLFELNRAAHTARDHFGAAHAFYAQAGRHEEEARVLIGYALAEGYLGHLHDAEAAIQRAMELLAPFPEHRHWMTLYLNLSLILEKQGRYEAMLACARTSAQLAHQRQKPDMYASALVNQGMAEMALGQLAQAEHTLHIAREHADQSADVRARALVNLARLSIYRGSLFDALRLLHEARHLFASVHLDIDQATVAIEEASLYARLQMQGEAYTAATMAAEMTEQADLPAESVEARLQAVRFGLARGTLSSISQHLTQARQFASRVSPVWQALLRAYAVHPRLLTTRAERDAAMPTLDQAAADVQAHGAVAEYLDVALIGAELAAVLHLPDAVLRYEQVADLAQTHTLPDHEQRALVELAHHQRPKAALQSLRRAADLATRVRQQMPVEELKAHLLSGTSGVYIRLVETLLKQRQPQEAAQVLLEAKGGIWADLREPADVPPPSAAWLRARAELTTWQEEARFASDPTYREVCVHRAQAAAAALATAARLQAHERVSHPLPDTDTLPAGLPVGAAVIDYAVGTTHLHACVLATGNPPQWVRLGKHRDIEQRMRQLSLLLKTVGRNPTSAQRWKVAQGQRQAINTRLAELYRLLVAPLEPLLADVSTLLLAPDGFLFAVPWAALHHPDGFLSERYSLALMPSAAMLGFPAEKRTATGPALALGAAGDPPLPAVVHELQAIRQAVPWMQCINPAHVRDLATVDAPALLHIAAHGTTSADAPLLSALELADGPFLLADTLRLNLHGTHLVSLSACETGTLPNQGGMLLALAGAFLCAGAQAVLASLWPVEDEATQYLMAQVYAAIGQGTPLPHALAQAQQAVRAAGYDHPFYWAAFQVIMRSAAPLTPPTLP